MRKIFTNAGFGAPGSITQTAGSMIAVLQACLVDGYGDQTPTSITRAGTTATMILPNAHDFTRTGVLNISGCNQADYNGEFRVTVVDATTVTFTVANSPITPATGTIVCRQDGAGWTIPFTGVNLAAFKQGAASNGLYLDVDDTLTASAKVRGYETMSGVGVGVSPFPTLAQEVNRYWTHGTTGSDWIVIADESFVLLWSPEGITSYDNAGAWFFGDYREASGVNIYGTLLVSGNTVNQPYENLNLLNSSATLSLGRYIARDYTQLGASTEVAVVGNSSMSQADTYAAGAGMDYPDPLSGNVYMQELAILVHNGASNLLGHVDGAYTMLHDTPFGASAISYFAGSGDFLNDEFVYMPGYVGAAMVFRISD